MRNCASVSRQRLVAAEPSRTSDGLDDLLSGTFASASLALRPVVSEGCPTEPISQDEVVTKPIAIAPRDNET